METLPTPAEETLEGQLRQLASLSARLNETRTLQEPAATFRLPLLGPAFAALRRWWLRATARWYAQPLLEQQNRFNEQVVRALDETARLLSAQLWATQEARELLQAQQSAAQAQAAHVRQVQEGLEAAVSEFRAAPRRTEKSLGPAGPVPAPVCGPEEEAAYWQSQAKEGLLTAQIAILYRLPSESEEAYLRRFEEFGAGDARMLNRYCPPDGRALEIGCGIGRILKHLQARERWGADISPAMLEWGAMYLQGQDGVHLIQTNGFDLANAPSHYFDLVYSIIVLQHVHKRAAFNYLLETGRVLKPGGRFVLEFMNLLSEEGFRQFQSVLRTAYPLDFYTPEEVRFKLERAGLQVDEVWTSEEQIWAIGHRLPVDNATERG